MAQHVEISEAGLGRMDKRIVGRIKLPSLGFGHMKPLSKVVTLNSFQDLTFCVENQDTETSSG
jgi:hypothetical protein